MEASYGDDTAPSDATTHFADLPELRTGRAFRQRLLYIVTVAV